MGRWENFAHLENTLTLEELFKIAEAIGEKDHQNRKFAAALKGINLDEESGMVDIRELNLTEATNDITGLRGSLAEKHGFGIGHGLGYIEV